MTYFCQSQRKVFLEELFAVISQHCYKIDLQAKNTSEHHSIFLQMYDEYPIHIAIATSGSLKKCKYKPDLKRLATV